jgi:hypothetical protein
MLIMLIIPQGQLPRSNENQVARQSCSFTTAQAPVFSAKNNPDLFSSLPWSRDRTILAYAMYALVLGHSSHFALTRTATAPFTIRHRFLGFHLQNDTNRKVL